MRTNRYATKLDRERYWMVQRRATAEAQQRNCLRISIDWMHLIHTSFWYLLCSDSHTFIILVHSCACCVFFFFWCALRGTRDWIKRKSMGKWVTVLQRLNIAWKKRSMQIEDWFLKTDLQPMFKHSIAMYRSKWLDRHGFGAKHSLCNRGNHKHYDV